MNPKYPLPNERVSAAELWLWALAEAGCGTVGEGSRTEDGEVTGAGRLRSDLVPPGRNLLFLEGGSVVTV